MKQRLRELSGIEISRSSRRADHHLAMAPHAANFIGAALVMWLWYNGHGGTIGSLTDRTGDGKCNLGGQGGSWSISHEDKDN